MWNLGLAERLAQSIDPGSSLIAQAFPLVIRGVTGKTVACLVEVDPAVAGSANQAAPLSLGTWVVMLVTVWGSLAKVSQVVCLRDEGWWANRGSVRAKQRRFCLLPSKCPTLQG
jgi:hypothetical protein